MTLQRLCIQPLSHGGQASRQAFQRDINVHWRDNNIIFIPRFPTCKMEMPALHVMKPLLSPGLCPAAAVTLGFTRLCIVLTVGDKEGCLQRANQHCSSEICCPRQNFTVAKLNQTIFITALRCVIHLEDVIFVASSLKGVPSANQSESIFISWRKNQTI